MTILFVELLGGIGDLLLALPAIHALARSHPGARVTVLTFAPGSALLSADPHISEVVVAQGDPTAAAARLVTRGFDLVVSDTRHGGIPEVLHGGRVVDDLWRRPPPDERIDLRFLRLLAKDGLIASRFRGLAPRVYLTQIERAAGRALVRHRTALLIPEAGMAIKEWAPQRFRTLAQRLAADGLAPLAVAGSDIGVPTLPPLSLRELAAVAAASAVCVAGDTGPARLATAVGTPTVALYGPTWAGRFGLRDDHVSLQSPLPCHVRNPANMTEQECWYSGNCVFDGRRTCVDELSAEEVHVRVLLAARQAGVAGTAVEEPDGAALGA